MKQIKSSKPKQTLLQRIKNHNAVDEIYFDCDGWWINLKDGFKWCGCSLMHEYTLTKLWNALRKDLDK